jgi:excisionase family DNA binding protein
MAHDMTMTDRLTKPEAQAYLRVSRATLDRLIATKTLPIIKLGRRVFIRQAALDQVLQAHETGGGAEASASQPTLALERPQDAPADDAPPLEDQPPDPGHIRLGSQGEGPTETPEPEPHHDTRKAALLARLRALYAEGHSLQAIANQLNAERVPTLSGKGRWQKGTVGNLLAQED